MAARLSSLLILCVCFTASAGAQSTTDSLLIIASEADERRILSAASEVSLRVESIEGMVLDRRVSQVVHRLLPDTLRPAETPRTGDPAPYRADIRAALNAMQALAAETRIAVRFVAEGTRRARPEPGQPGVPGMAAVTAPPPTGRERLRQVTDIAQPLLLGSGTVMRSYSETASVLLIAGGVASAIIGYVTAPERPSPETLIPAQLRGTSPADTAQAPGLAAYLAGARGANLAGAAGVELEARQLMLDEYNRQAAHLISSLAQIESELRSVAGDWEREGVALSELREGTANAAAGLARLMDRAEQLGSASDGFSRELVFTAEAFMRVDPRTEEPFRLARNRAQIFTSAYKSEVDPRLISHLGTARLALSRFQSATLSIR